MSRLLTTSLVPLFVLTFILIAQSCQTSRASRLAKRGYDKIQKAIELDPTIVDSLHRIDTVKIIIPARKDSSDIEAVRDSSAFEKDISDYDSLLSTTKDLSALISSGELDSKQLEQALYRERKINEQLREKRGRLFKGYLIDSIYNYSDDHLSINFRIKDGTLSGMDYEIKEIQVDTAVVKTDIILDPNRKSWYARTFKGWGLGLLGYVFLVIAAILFIKSIFRRASK